MSQLRSTKLNECIQAIRRFTYIYLYLVLVRIWCKIIFFFSFWIRITFGVKILHDLSVHSPFSIGCRYLFLCQCIRTRRMEGKRIDRYIRDQHISKYAICSIEQSTPLAISRCSARIKIVNTQCWIVWILNIPYPSHTYTDTFQLLSVYLVCIWFFIRQLSFTLFFVIFILFFSFCTFHKSHKQMLSVAVFGLCALYVHTVAAL